MELNRSQKELVAEIQRLKKKKKAVVLCHNYQRPEIYEVADFIGDSLELCRKAKDSKAKMIIFCGVHFMAESAAVLNPGLKVIIPARDAGCALADMITVESLRAKRAEYPDAAVVCYVNSTAEVKAESDVCCTSANAVKVVKALPNRRIIFVPDKNLADFVSEQAPEKEIIPWGGYCPIHQRLTREYLLKAKEMHPKAKIIVHPECTEEVRSVADYVVSTSGMLKSAMASGADEFICTTECGMIQRMSKAMPDKKFFSVCSVCFEMKKITLEKVAHAIVTGEFEIKIPANIMKKAAKSFQKMFDIL